MSEVRAPLLVHARRRTADRVRRASSTSFAGRTFGSLSMTWDPHYREPFQPLLPGVTFVSGRTIRRRCSPRSPSRTAAIIAEPIQGEGGVRPLSPELAAAIEAACARTGALYIADEMQCGIGRTGELFHFAALGLTPDLVSVGKALGGGFPVGAALCPIRSPRPSRPAITARPTAATRWPAARRSTSLDRARRRLAAHVRRCRPALRAGAAGDGRERPGPIAEIRGKGLMWGVDLGRDAGAVVHRGPHARAGRQSHVGLGDPACCRRTSSPNRRSTAACRCSKPRCPTSPPNRRRRSHGHGSSSRVPIGIGKSMQVVERSRVRSQEKRMPSVSVVAAGITPVTSVAEHDQEAADVPDDQSSIERYAAAASPMCRRSRG